MVSQPFEFTSGKRLPTTVIHPIPDKFQFRLDFIAILLAVSVCRMFAFQVFFCLMYQTKDCPSWQYNDKLSRL